MAPIVHIVVVLVTITFFGISNADYQCVCNYNVEIGVMPNASDQGVPLGSLYEFDCKESIPSMNKDEWMAIAFEHKIGYIKQDQQTQEQICQGTAPSFDKVTTTTAPTTTSTPKTTTNSTTPTTTTTTTLKTTTKPTTPTTQSTTLTTTTTTLRTTTQPKTKLTTRTTRLPTTSTPTTTPTTTTTTTTTKSTTTTTTTTKSTTTTTTTTKPSTLKPTTQPTTSTTQTSTSTTSPTTTTTTMTTARLTTSKYPTTTVYVVSGKPKLCPPVLRDRVQADRNILTQYGDSCYEIVTNGQAQWINAETYCKHYGGHLVAIDTNGEQIFINNYLRHNYYHPVWIGLNKTGNNNLRWSTGDQVSYAHWHSTSSSGCTMLSPSDAGMWYSKPCQTNLNYICEFARTTMTTTKPSTLIPTTQPTTSTTQTSTSTTSPTTTRLTSPTTSKYPTTTVYVVSGKPNLCSSSLQDRVQADRNILTQYGDSCYEIVTNGQAPWINAETYCKQYGGHLVAIDTNGEQIFIHNYLRHNYYHPVWIGLNQTGNNNNNLRWSTGDQVSYAHWHSTSNSGCTMLSPSDAGMWYSKPCQTNLNYICEFDRHSTVSTATKVPVTDSSGNIISGRPNMCPSNLIYHVKDVGSHLTQYGNMCYETVGDQYSWSQTENYCSKFGGHLVTIDNSQEQTFIYRYLTQYFPHSVWIGLSDSVKEGNFKWASGSSSGYRHWYADPNGWKSGFEDCALLAMTHNGRWDDRDCDSTHYFMCEYNINGVQMPTTPAPATGFSVPGDTSRCSSKIRSWARQDGGELGYYHGSCYELLPYDKVSHDHAIDMCNDRGGELVDILNQSEQNFVEAFLKMFSPQHAVWTGLHDKYSENYFEWQSGARVQYTNWIPGHVSNFVNHRDEDCVVIIPYKGGQWDDIPCGSYDYFFGDSDETHPPLCEFKMTGNAFVG